MKMKRQWSVEVSLKVVQVVQPTTGSCCSSLKSLIDGVLGCSTYPIFEMVEVGSNSVGGVDWYMHNEVKC